jgi:hypothetical protein
MIRKSISSAFAGLLIVVPVLAFFFMLLGHWKPGSGAALTGLDQGTFTEGHELDRKTEKQTEGDDWTPIDRRRRRRDCWLSWDDPEGRPGRAARDDQNSLSNTAMIEGGDDYLGSDWVGGYCPVACCTGAGQVDKSG